jgi:hypothetical protein
VGNALRLNRPLGPVNESAEDLLPWLTPIDVFQQAKSNTNWASSSTETTMVLNGHRQSSAAQNDSVEWNVSLAAGTWDVELLHTTLNTNGIYHVSLDGTEVGTIDSYSASQTPSVRSTIAGIEVSRTGVHEFQLKMASKNVSSSQYYARLQHVQLRCTARAEGGGRHGNRVPGRRVSAQWPSCLAPDWIDHVAALTASDHLNANNTSGDANYINRYSRTSSSAQNDWIEFWMSLKAGTWDFELLHHKDNNRGIYTVSLDGVTLGTIDGYAGSTTLNQRDSLSGIAVPRSGMHRLRMTMASKNASSSLYYCIMDSVRMMRTG